MRGTTRMWLQKHFHPPQKQAATQNTGKVEKTKQKNNPEVAARSKIKGRPVSE